MTEESSPQPIFHLDLHAWIESQQTAHGVRHDDFGQYHAYCTRRLSRLSHNKETKQYLVCSSKFATTSTTNKQQRSRHAYASRKDDTFANPPQHESVLWYLVVSAERSWAHANLIKRQHGKRQMVLRKLKRAKRWAIELEQMASDSTDSVTYMECQAYASWMAANLALEQFDYSTASTAYAVAMTLCHDLSRLPVTEQEQEDSAKALERQDLFLNRSDTLLRPLFRYCQYECKQAGEEIVEEPRWNSSTSQQTEDDDQESSISFRGQDLVLESKELRVLLLKLQSLQEEKNITEEEKRNEDDTVFLNVLSVLDDALEVVQESLNSLEQANSGPAIQAKRTQYLLWKGYLQSEKTKRVMDHTQGLLQDIEGHAERVHVYDALLQHAKSLLQLPRPSSSDGEEEEDEFALQVQANVLRLRALKTYHMAWYYYENPKKYDAALALIQQSSKLSKRAKEEIAACDEDMPHADEYLQELEDLPITSATTAIHAAMYLKTQGGMASATDRPLLLRLPEEDSGTTLAELTPMPMPCKPTFFDLAMGYALDSTESIEKIQSYIDFHTESSEPELEEEEEEVSSSGRGGLFGWLGGK